MQQARGVAPDRSPAWRQDLAAILAYKGLQPRAANVWAALYVRADGPGSLDLDATDIAALVGLKQPRSLTAANNGTPGHLDTLAGIGAIDWDGARVRFVAAPADADRPRPAVRPANDTPPLPAMADVDEPLPELPAEPPKVATVAMPRREERADFAARFAGLRARGQDGIAGGGHQRRRWNASEGR